MQGTLQKEKFGCKWMRIGFADKIFSTIFLIISFSAMILLAIWAYQELPKTKWRWGYFILIYLGAAIFYTNIGVWLHEQLHCLVFRGGDDTSPTQISFSRKYFLFLDGHYTVKGPIPYRKNRRALLAPILLPLGLSFIGLIGDRFLPGWWFPVLLTMAVAGVLDMIHDFYMVLKIQQIGEKGKYWDRGQYLEVVWKEQTQADAA